MRSTRLIGIGALTTAALLGTCFTATANAAVGGYGDDHGGNNNDLHGYHIVQEDGPANGDPVTADCPLGGRVTGGGVKIIDPSRSSAIQATYPKSNGDGWVGAGVGPAGTEVLTVYAICTKVGDNHYEH